ncbi:hypothetical protein [Streptomyces noursei]|nr:hypothetical protein [Streptomyces noursei]
MTPHIARGRRLVLGLFTTAVVISTASVVALVQHVLRQLGG